MILVFLYRVTFLKTQPPEPLAETRGQAELPGSGVKKAEPPLPSSLLPSGLRSEDHCSGRHMCHRKGLIHLMTKSKRKPRTPLSALIPTFHLLGDSHVAIVVKNPPANAKDIRDLGSIPGLGRSPGGRHGNPLQYSCLENPVDRGAWQAAIHRVAKSRARMKRFTTRAAQAP